MKTRIATPPYIMLIQDDITHTAQGSPPVRSLLLTTEHQMLGR
jgi:hypothetical protein